MWWALFYACVFTLPLYEVAMRRKLKGLCLEECKEMNICQYTGKNDVNEKHDLQYQYLYQVLIVLFISPVYLSSASTCTNCTCSTYE
jgi:hypothetical protein